MTDTVQQYIPIPRFKLPLELPWRKMLFPSGIALAIFLLLAAMSPSARAADSDPFERVNRATYAFNDTFDKALLKPIATGYSNYMPTVAKTGIRNFFSNLGEVRVTFNDLLQFKFLQAASDLGRFAINSTVGIAGLIDVAAPAFNLEKNRQDFGKTLAYWGAEPGPYLVLPFFGPSTVRDAFGVGFDSTVDPAPSVDHVPSRNSLLATENIDSRADYLNVDDLIIGDEYLFVRGAYLQAREYSIKGEYMEVAFEDF